MSGAARIFLYNWPIYLGTFAASALAAAMTFMSAPRWFPFATAAGLAAIAWSAWSLLVSYYIYDRSTLVGGTWLSPLLPVRTERWVAIDAGLDAEVALDAVLPGRCVARLDIYDDDIVVAPSVKRARATTPRTHAATSIKATALPLDDASCDVVTVVFSAHEVRRVADREAFFVELARVLRDGGRMVLVEHVRDLANFVAFGPGFLHFLGRGEWLRLAGLAKLTVAEEIRVTPWVMALALEKHA